MKLLSAVMTIGGWTMVSRILGFIRDACFAIVIGVGMITDAFFVAFRFPNIFRALFAEGAMNAVFTPLFTKHVKQDGIQSGQLLVQNICILLLAWSVVFCFVMIYFMHYIMYIQAYGFSADTQKFHLTVSLSQIIFPYLGFMILNALFSSILNAQMRFSIPAFSPCILNIVSLGVLGLIYWDYISATGYELAIGVLVAGVLQSIILLGACIRLGINPFGMPRSVHKGTKVFFKKVLPVIFGAGVLQLNVFIGTIIATGLTAGSVSYLYYADRLVQLPIGVIGVAIGIVLLPVLTRSILDNNVDSIRKNQSEAVVLSLFFTMPAFVALLCINQEIIAGLFMYGKFTHADVVQTANALQAYALGLPAYILLKIFINAFFGRGDTKTPMIVSMIAVGVNIALAIVLKDIFAHVGLALALSISGWCNVGILYSIMCMRGYALFSTGLRLQIIKITVCSGIMGAVLLVIKYSGVMAIFNNHTLSLFVLVIIGKILYFSSILITKTVSVQQIKQSVLRR